MNGMNKVLYDPVDRRCTIYANGLGIPPEIRKQAASVACFVEQTLLIKEGPSGPYRMSGSVPTLSVRIQQRFQYPLGENERFAQEKTMGRATGFLVTDDTVLTAGHVVCDKQGPNSLDLTFASTHYVVFDYCMEEVDRCKTVFSEQQVFRIKNVVDHFCSEINDWALVQLDRKVPGRTPVTLNFSPLQSDVTLYMLGYPSGLPIKLTTNGIIMDNSPQSYFACKVDAFKGNSGSPLFRADTHEVVALLFRGEKDYVLDPNYQGNNVTRYVPNRINPAHIETYELCQRMSSLLKVQEYVAYWSSGFRITYENVPPGVSTPGFYVLGHCTNSICQLGTKRDVWIPRPGETFHLEDVLYNSSCTFCNKGNIHVSNIGLHESVFSISGQLTEPQKALFRLQNAVASGKMGVFDSSQNFIWSHLKIQVIHLKKTP